MSWSLCMGHTSTPHSSTYVMITMYGPYVDTILIHNCHGRGVWFTCRHHTHPQLSRSLRVGHTSTPHSSTYVMITIYEPCVDTTLIHSCHGRCVWPTCQHHTHPQLSRSLRMGHTSTPHSSTYVMITMYGPCADTTIVHICHDHYV